MKRVSVVDSMLLLGGSPVNEIVARAMESVGAFTFLLENIWKGLFDVRSGEKMSSVSVVILVAFDRMSKTESRNRNTISTPARHHGRPH